MTRIRQSLEQGAELDAVRLQTELAPTLADVGLVAGIIGIADRPSDELVDARAGRRMMTRHDDRKPIVVTLVVGHHVQLRQQPLQLLGRNLARRRSSIRHRLDRYLPDRIQESRGRLRRFEKRTSKDVVVESVEPPGSGMD